MTLFGHRKDTVMIPDKYNLTVGTGWDRRTQNEEEGKLESYRHELWPVMGRGFSVRWDWFCLPSECLSVFKTAPVVYRFLPISHPKYFEAYFFLFSPVSTVLCSTGCLKLVVVLACCLLDSIFLVEIKWYKSLFSVRINKERKNKHFEIRIL